MDVALLEGKRRHFLVSAVIVFLIAVVCVGVNYGYDCVSALAAPLESLLGLDAAEFALFTSICAFPNIVLVLVGGVFVDSVGSVTAGIVLSTLVTVGSAGVALGSLYRSFPAMLASRFLFGLGAESLYVVQNTMALEEFHGDNLASVMGVALSVGRIGSIAAFAVSSSAARDRSVPFSLAIAVLVCASGFVAVAAYGLITYEARRLRRAEEAFCRREHGKKSRVDPLMHRLCPTAPGVIHTFPPVFWLWVLCIVSMYGAIFPFKALAAGGISRRYNLPATRAGSMLAWIDTVALCLSPLCGILVDRSGLGSQIVVGGCALLAAVFAVSGITTAVPPIAILVAIGVSFSAVPAALWPFISLTLPPAQAGTGFALASALNNAGTAALTPLLGVVLDRYGWSYGCFLCSSLAFCALAAAVVASFVGIDEPAEFPELVMKAPTLVRMHSWTRERSRSCAAIVSGHPDRGGPREEWDYGAVWRVKSSPNIKKPEFDDSPSSDPRISPKAPVPDVLLPEDALRALGTTPPPPPRTATASAPPTVSRTTGAGRTG